MTDSSGAAGQGIPHVLDPDRIRELLTSISPYHTLDKGVQDALIDIADEFVDSVMGFACQLAKHRGSDVVEVRDIALHLEKNWGIRVPGFSSAGPLGESTYVMPRLNTEVHKQRLRLKERAEATLLRQEDMQREKERKAQQDK